MLTHLQHLTDKIARLHQEATMQDAATTRIMSTIQANETASALRTHAQALRSKIADQEISKLQKSIRAIENEGGGQVTKTYVNEKIEQLAQVMMTQFTAINDAIKTITDISAIPSIESEPSPPTTSSSSTMKRYSSIIPELESPAKRSKPEDSSRGGGDSSRGRDRDGGNSNSRSDNYHSDNNNNNRNNRNNTRNDNQSRSRGSSRNRDSSTDSRHNNQMDSTDTHATITNILNSLIPTPHRKIESFEKVVERTVKSICTHRYNRDVAFSGLMAAIYKPSANFGEVKEAVDAIGRAFKV